MKIAAQMDEITAINFEADSTFAVLFALQERGHQIFYYLPHDLSFFSSSGKLSALVKEIRLQKKKGDHVKVLAAHTRDLTEFDVILFRQDPPFDMNYLTTSYLLEKIKDKVLIINNPTEIRNCPEKILVTDYPHLTPPTLLTKDLAVVREFQHTHKNIIIKPLYANGGEGVILIKENDPNLSSAFEMLSKFYHAPVVVQKFLPEVSAGDKRVILVNGKVAGAVNRVAKTGEVRSNLHIGGSAAATELTKREQAICAELGPELKKRGLFFVGIDLIGEMLTEINVTSPTGINEINRLNNVRVDLLIAEEIEKLVA